VGLAVLLASTGGFHFDGLADTLDGFGGGYSREQKLEIMRDSRIGTYGTLGVVVFALLRYACYETFAPNFSLVACVGPLMIGRLSSLWLIRWLPYARTEASVSQKPVVTSLKDSSVGMASLYTAGIILITGGWFSAIALFLAALVIGLMLGNFFKCQIGGVTGDTLGAANIVLEGVSMVIFLVLYRS
jgi:adenosylcobinamide-GDP ribazoletransferase